MYYQERKAINQSPAPSNLINLTDQQISMLTLIEARLQHLISKINYDYHGLLKLRQNGCEFSVNTIFTFDSSFHVCDSVLMQNFSHNNALKCFNAVKSVVTGLGLTINSLPSVSLFKIQSMIKQIEKDYEENDARMVDVPFEPFVFSVPEDYALPALIENNSAAGIAQTVYHLSRGDDAYLATVNSEENTFKFEQIVDGVAVDSMNHFSHLLGQIKKIEQLSACGLCAEATQIFFSRGYKVKLADVAYTDTPAIREYKAFNSYSVGIAHPTTGEVSTIDFTPYQTVRTAVLNIKDSFRLGDQLIYADKKIIDATVKGSLNGYRFKSSKLKTSKIKQTCARTGIKTITFEVNEYRQIPTSANTTQCGEFASRAPQVSIKLNANGLTVKVTDKQGDIDESEQAKILVKAFKKHKALFKGKNTAEIRYLITRILNDQYNYANLEMR